MPKTKYTSYSATTPEGIKKLREGANARRKAFVAGKSGGKASSSTKKTSKHGPRERSNSIGGKAKTVASTAASTTAKDPELSGRIKTTFKKGMTQAQRRKAQVANQKRVHAKRKAHKATQDKAQSAKNRKSILADRSKTSSRSRVTQAQRDRVQELAAKAVEGTRSTTTTSSRGRGSARILKSY